MFLVNQCPYEHVCVLCTLEFGTCYGGYLADYDKAIRLLSLVQSSVQTDLEILANEEAEDKGSFDTYGDRENIIASEFLLADYEVDEVEEGSGSEESHGTDNPSKNLDFGFIQEITSF